MSLTQVCKSLLLNLSPRSSPEEEQEKAHDATIFASNNNSPWRRPYESHTDLMKLKTFIYSFTWEDPEVDMRHLALSSSDSVFVITSAGDNPLHYSVAASPRNMVCVDMNPCQGHLLELKLAAIKSLDYSDFFAIFGRGYHPHFQKLLNTRIRHYLSDDAYRYWMTNSNSFASSFYEHGYSGRAVRFARILWKVAGVREEVDRLCHCDSVEEQTAIWQKLRSIWLNPFTVALLRSSMFCWNALGVPMNQRDMLIEEGGMHQYICDTLDPVLSTYSLKSQNYFYLLCLLGHYTAECCPTYLTRDGFEKLKADDGRRLNAFQLHTATIVNVLCGLPSSSLTRALVMDHLDWYDPGSNEVECEVAELFRAVSSGGFVFWRSASRYPWYNEVFRQVGFHVEAISVRQPGKAVALDRVNMYASFWKATKS